MPKNRKWGSPIETSSKKTPADYKKEEAAQQSTPERTTKIDEDKLRSYARALSLREEGDWGFARHRGPGVQEERNDKWRDTERPDDN